MWGEERMGARHILHAHVSSNHHQYESHHHPASMAYPRGSHRAADGEWHGPQRRRRGRARDPSIGTARRGEVHDDDRIWRPTPSHRDHIHPENVRVEDPIHHERRRTDRLDRDKQRHHSHEEDTVQHGSDPESRTRFVSDHAEAFSGRIDVQGTRDQRLASRGHATVRHGQHSRQPQRDGRGVQFHTRRPQPMACGRETLVRQAVVHPRTRRSTIHGGERKPDVQPGCSGVVFTAGQEVEGGIVSVGTHVGGGTSESDRIGQRPTGQRRERTLSPWHYDRSGHGGVHHVVSQRVQREPEPEVRTSIRTAGGGGISSVLFVVDRAVRPHFAEQPRADDVQFVVMGASARRRMGRRRRGMGGGRRGGGREGFARDTRGSECRSTFHPTAFHSDSRPQLRRPLGNEPDPSSHA